MDIKKEKGPRIHIILFIITFITTTLAGAEWMFGRFVIGPYKLRWEDFIDAMQFSIPFLAILTVHEFGHYFMAKKNNVKVSLPFFLPLWFGFIGLPTIGTMGAFIRIRERIQDKTQNFDIGIAGPLAGFVLAIFVLIYGFTNLPPKEYIFNIHPEYQVLGENFDQVVYTEDTFVLKTDVSKFNPEYAEIMSDTTFFSPDKPSFAMGNNLLFSFMERYIVPQGDRDRIPNHYEAFHYPYLFAGFLALFFTALNLLPIGQLDGGHVVYGMFGSKNHAIISRVFFLLLVYYAGLGLINPYQAPGGSGDVDEYLIFIPLYVFFLFYIFKGLSPNVWTRLTWAIGLFAAQYITSFFYPLAQGYSGWLLFAFMIGRFLGIDYPPALVEEPLSKERQILGWIALIILVLSFSPAPLVVTGI